MAANNYGQEIINKIIDNDRREGEEKNGKSMLVRIINRSVTPQQALSELPKMWKAVGRVEGRSIGHNILQFFFKEEEMLQQVLSKAPFLLNGKAVAGERWTYSPGPDYLKQLPLWVNIIGFPSHTASSEEIVSICWPLGRFEKFELNAGPEYHRAKIWISIEVPLILWMKTFIPNTGELVSLQFTYDDIEYCTRCDRITHNYLSVVSDFYSCPRGSNGVQTADLF